MIGALFIFVLVLSWTGYWLMLKGQLPMSDGALVIIGTILLIGSVLVPFLIIMKVLISTYFWNFLSYEFILLGMMFFVFGVGGMGRPNIPAVGKVSLREYALGLERLKKRSELGPSD